MRSRYLVLQPARPHFVTATIVEWLPVFTTGAACDILVRALLHTREHKQLRIHGWVILDNHWHAVLGAPDLSGVLRDLKSFTAREILRQLAVEGREYRNRSERGRASGSEGVWSLTPMPSAPPLPPSPVTMATLGVRKVSVSRILAAMASAM